jgi:signal transduction histidine kinase
MPSAISHLTRADARDLFVGATLARPEQQLSVLAQRLSARTGATGVSLLEQHSGRIQSRDLLQRSSVSLDASDVELRLYALAGQVPKLVDETTLIVSAPTTPQKDPLQPSPAPAVLVLRFARNAPFLSGRARSWPALRVLGNLTHVLLETEHANLLNSRLRQLHRRSVRPRRSSDLAYLVLHAARDVLRFDGHCALLMWEPTDTTLEVMAHVAGEGAQADDPTFAIPWSVEHEHLLLDTRSHQHCFLASHHDQDDATVVREISEIGTSATPQDSPAAPIVAEAVAQLVGALTDAKLARGRSTLLFPLRQGGTALGLLTISAQSEDAFTTRELSVAWEMALSCIPPLARESRLAGDFRLSESVLERTAALEPDVPLGQNGPLEAILTLLCDRLARETSADVVTLLPYAYKRGELVWEGVASAGLELQLDRCRLRPGGILEQILRTGRSVEWHRVDGEEPHDLRSIVAAWDIERVFGVPLNTEGGSPLGAVLIGWRGDPPLPERQRSDISRLDRQRIEDFRRVAEGFLSRHDAWFLELTSKRLLSEVYTDLLRSIGRESEDPIAADFRAVRHTILLGLVSTARELIGGTTGLFAEPSGEHAGLDVVRSVGHDPSLDGSRVPFGHGVTGRCAEVKAMQVIPDRDDPSTWPAGVEPRRANVAARCEIAFPVTDGSVSDLLLGVFDLENDLITHAYGDSDARLTHQIAQAASIAIGLTRQLEQVQSVARLGRRIDEAIRDSEEAVFRVALEEAARVTGSFAASARVADRSGTQLLPVHHHGDPGRFSGTPIAVGDGINGAAFRSEQALYIGDTHDPATYPDVPGLTYLPSREETRSECTIPIHWYGSRIGACNFEHRQPQALAPFQLYLQTVGVQISHAVRRRREGDKAQRKQGVELVEVLSAFYATVVHTISNRFLGIRNEIAKFEQRHGAPLDAAEQALLRRIKSMAESGTTDAAALLAGAGGKWEEAVVVAIPVVLDALASHVAELHGSSDRLTIEYGASDARVVAREAMLGWILQEVVQNSYAYAGENAHVWISVRTHPARGTVEILLDDDGPGLPPERLASLYDPRARERHDGHHSMGLIATEYYLRTMSGHISSKRSPRGGLRTVIELPWHRHETERAA